jgi:hypothetical protein
LASPILEQAGEGFKKQNPKTAKVAKDLRKERKELFINILTLRPL